MRLACRSVCSALFAVFAWFVTAPASAAPAAGWQAVAVASAEGKAAEILLEDGRRFPLENPESLSGNFGVELRVGGRVLSDDGKTARFRLERAAIRESVPVERKFQPGRKNFYSRNRLVIPDDALTLGASIDLEMPELGTSASSGGSSPIMVRISLPENYRRETPHPVIFHFGGGSGSASEVMRYREIVGQDNFILIGADYDYEENVKAGTLKIGTCRDFDSRIALYVLQALRNSTMIDEGTVILSGYSSGAYSITDNFRKNPKAWRHFSGFCAIAGGSQTGSPRIEARPVLFLMGREDTLRHGWMNEAVEGLKRGRASAVTVRMLDGVGHEWSSAQTPVIREWLCGNFPSIGAAERRRRLLDDLSDPKAKAVVQRWIDNSGLR